MFNEKLLYWIFSYLMGGENLLNLVSVGQFLDSFGWRLFNFTYSPIHLFIYSSIHLLIYSSIHLFIYSPIHLFTYSFIHLFIYSSIHLFIYSPIHLFIYTGWGPWTAWKYTSNRKTIFPEETRKIAHTLYCLYIRHAFNRYSSSVRYTLW